MSESDLIRSARFHNERKKDWKELEDLLAKVQRGGLGNLSFHQANRLSALYRQAMHSLSLAREISMDRALHEYLESLCTRSYLAVYAPRDTLRELVKRYFTVSAPRAVRKCKWVILLSALFMVLGGVVGFGLTQSDNSWYHSFVPGGLSKGRGPEATAEQLRKVLYNKELPSPDQLASFSTTLFAHNTQVSITSFAVGIMAAIPTALLLFYNGTIVGAFAAVHHEKGLALDLFGWLSIHGVTELSAIIIAAAGGLHLGMAVLFPGQLTRGYALRRAGRDAVKLAVLAALMLLVAGILEGVFRQVITDTNQRILIGWGIGLLWLLWLSLAGRKTGGSQ